MALVWADRVRDTSTTTGTGDITLSGSPPTGFQAFSAALTTNDTCYGFIAHQTVNEWEVCLFTMQAGGVTLARTTTLASSNSGSPVSFSSGTKDVMLDVPASVVVTMIPPFTDATAVVKGSSDTTKQLRFEVDGFTTGTTRVLTPPNADATIAGQNFANTFTATQTISTGNLVMSSAGGSFSVGDGSPTFFAPIHVGNPTSFGTVRWPIEVKDNPGSYRYLFGISDDANIDSILNIPDTGTARFKFTRAADIANTVLSVTNAGVVTIHGATTGTVSVEERADFSAYVVDNAFATRKYGFILAAWDTAARNVLYGEADGTGGNAAFFAAPSVGGGRGVIFIANAAVVPTTDPTGGGILYCEGGALKYRGSGGTVTTIANA